MQKALQNKNIETFLVFSEEWFKKYQNRLLWLCNVPILKHWFRYVLRIHSYDCPIDTKITELGPNRFSFGDKVIFDMKSGKLLNQRTTDFRTHDKFAKRLYFAFKPMWWAFHAWDWLVADRYVPDWSFGFNTLTQWPGSIGSGNPVDGNVGIQGGSGALTWSAIHGASSGDTTNVAPDQTWCIFIRSLYSSGNKWDSLMRSIFCFDTSSLGAGATISATTMSLYGESKYDGLAITPNIDIYTSTPGSTSTLVNSDFNKFGTVSQTGSPITYSGFGTNTYNDFAFNATGIGNVNKTGISQFSTRNQNYDVANSEPAWSNNVASNLGINFSGHTGTTQDPKLVVTYTVVTAPTVTTQAVTSISTTTATGNGNITATNGENPTYYGVVYGTGSHGDPGNTAPGSSGYAGNVQTGPGSYGTGAFTESLSSLSAGTTYYVRAWAWNSAGYAYGGEVSFGTTATVSPVDTLTCSESQTFSIITYNLSLSVNDALTCSELVTCFIPILKPALIIETSTCSELVTLYITILKPALVTDTLTCSELVTIQASSPQVNVNDALTYSETQALYITILKPALVFDTLTYSETTTASMSSWPVIDTLAVSEQVTLYITTLFPTLVTDTLTCLELVTLYIPEEGRLVDNLTVSELVTVQASSPQVNVNDTLVYSEATTLQSSSPQVSATDTLTLSEVVAMNVQTGVIISDILVASDTVNISTVTLLSLSDSLTVSDLVTLIPINCVSVIDSLTLNETYASKTYTFSRLLRQPAASTDRLQGFSIGGSRRVR